MDKLALEEEEVDTFVDRVDEVTRLIEGLKDGTLPPEYVDKREAEIIEREQKKDEKRKKEEQEREENRFDKLPKERQEELLKKVEEIQRNKERKDKLRAAFEAHVKDGESKGTASGTDYHAWDLWTPSDEEDDIYNQLTPNSPEFKAMEKDIDERHAKLLRCRQYAERQRELGNKMFKEKQYAKALQIYEDGISAEKANMALNANAAAACLKLGCNIQAIEHCDKVFSIADFCHENKPSTIPMRVKAYQRRATARLALNHFKEAIADLNEAKSLVGENDKEVNQQLQKAEKLYAEHKVAKKLKKVLDSNEVNDEEGKRLKQISACSKGLSVNSGKQEESCKQLAELVKDYENGRIFVRECGALNKVLQLYLDLSKETDSGKSSNSSHATVVGALEVLDLACGNEQNAEYVCNYNLFLKTCLAQLGKTESKAEQFAILQVLHTCSIEIESRKKIVLEVKNQSSAAVVRLCSFLNQHTAHNLLFVALQLLGNLCLYTPFRKELATFPDLWRTVEQTLDILGSQQLVKVHEAVGSLLGNLCNEARVRKMFTENGKSLKSLLDFIRTRKLNQMAKERFPKLLVVITNLIVDEANQEILCKYGGVLRMLDLLEEFPMHSKQVLSIIARLSRTPSGAKTLISSGNLAKLFRRASIDLTSLSALDGMPEDTQDAIMRIVANVIMKAGIDLVTVSNVLFPLGFYSFSRKAIGSSTSSDLIVGNAALCISELAKSDVVMQELDQQGAIDLIEPLTHIAHKRTGSAQRNAAIALARMAKTPQYIDKLREHHAFEIIAKYVKI